MAVPVERVSPITRVAKSSDIFLAIAVIAIVAMIIIPVPPFLLNILVAFSLVFSLVVLLITLYTIRPLQFAVFPSLIILTTVYRLSLNISTTRSILARADAGRIIDVFGSFVVGGNYVVGFIIFVIIMVVNFLVIAYGAVRIGEVAARFTLDAMPGKQMAIDADLNAGLITEDQARQRRLNLEREADFFGAMDGAARFVQRDAIAGLIITVVNIIGGFIVGIVQLKMDWHTALTTYTRLSIGDGLAAALPALLMSTATGIIVTNAVSEANLGEDIASQILAHPRAILIGGSVILLAFGMLPGMGWARLLFFFLSGALFIGWYLLQQAKVEEEKIKEEEKKAMVRPPESVLPLLQVDPLELEIGYALIPLVDVEQGGDLLDRVTMIRRQIALDMGLVVPPIRIRDNMQLPPSGYTIKIRGVEVAKGEVYIDHYLAMNPGEVTERLEGIDTKEPAFGLPAVWISAKQRERAENLGYTVVDATTVIATHLTEVIKSHAAEILGRQELQQMIDNLKQNYPVVVDELIPNLMSLGEVQKVLQNLLKEKVSIRDLVTVLETLADYSKLTKDLDVLTEYVRVRLARTICQQYQTKEGKLMVMTLDPQLEQKLADLLTQSGQGNYLVLEPNFAQRLIDGISQMLEKMVTLGYPPVILCSSRIRLALYRFLEKVIPQITVLSYNEIIPQVKLESIGVVNINEG